MNDLEDQDGANAQSGEQFAETAAPAEQFSKADLEKSFQIRLRKERQKNEEHAKNAQALQKKLDDLQSKFDSGKATSEESAQYMKATNTKQEARSAGIPPEDIPHIIKNHMELQTLENNISTAAEKDPELKNLLNDPASLNKISAEELTLLKDLPNAAAVFKHLLTDDRDRSTLKAAERAWIGPAGDGVGGDGGFRFMEFVNNISKQLESTAKYPHPPGYKAAANLDDAGQTNVFTIDNYIATKYQ